MSILREALFFRSWSKSSDKVFISSRNSFLIWVLNALNSDLSLSRASFHSSEDLGGVVSAPGGGVASEAGLAGGGFVCGMREKMEDGDRNVHHSATFKELFLPVCWSHCKKCASFSTVGQSCGLTFSIYM